MLDLRERAALVYFVSPTHPRRRCRSPSSCLTLAFEAPRSCIAYRASLPENTAGDQTRFCGKTRARQIQHLHMSSCWASHGFPVQSLAEPFSRPRLLPHEGWVSLYVSVSAHKSQHFVPQHYLRPFSSDGRSVRLCHLKSGQIVSNASIKNQCCRDYFYGKDQRIEHALARMEGGDETVLKQVRETLQLPAEPGNRARLSLLAILLNGRTEKNINQISDAVSEIKTETAHRMVKLNLIKPPPGVSLDGVRLKDTDNLAPKMAIQSAVDHLCAISDLRMKLLLAPDNHEFITSDHPTAIVNQRFQGRTDFPLSGLVMKGIQIVLPVSPFACLFIYDPDCYRVGFRRKERFIIQRREDIETLNALQILNANAVVYFRGERLSNNVAAVRSKFFERRRQSRSVQKFSTQRGGLLFMLKKEDVRIPTPWSFCKIRHDAPTSFGPRDSEVVALYERWGDEQRQRKDRISFTDWLRETFPKLHHDLIRS